MNACIVCPKLTQLLSAVETGEGETTHDSFLNYVEYL